MKCLVRSDVFVACVFGAIGGVLVGLTNAGVGATYAIAFGLGAIGFLIIFDVEDLWPWRAMQRLRGRR
jgi:hypothetical protein